MKKNFKYIRFDEKGRPEPRIKPYLNPAIDETIKKYGEKLKKEIIKIYAMDKNEFKEGD